MANGTIKITNKSRYTIDIKDENDEVFHTLVFNLDDVNFPIKAIEFFDDAKRTLRKLQDEENTLKAQLLSDGINEVIEIEDITEENIDKVELPKQIKEFYLMQARAFEELRNLLDNFLGKGTCEAIFGDVNSVSMFREFVEGLTPEFEKMGVRIEAAQANLYKKYAPKNKSVMR